MTVCYWCGAKDTLADVGKELDDGKYKMVQCSKCKNAYYVLNKEKMNKPKQMTNEEWLRQCNMEQLADVLLEHFEWGLSINAEYCFTEKYVEQNREHILEWLKQPHTLGE